MSDAVDHDFEVRQEPDVSPAGPILRVSAVSVVVGAVAVFFAGLLLSKTIGTIRPDLAGTQGPRPAAREIGTIEQTPLLVTRTGLDLRQEQLRALSSWGWADRDAGIAIIPIEQAMDIELKESR